MSEAMIGFGAFIGLAEEVTYGTAVTPSTLWVPIVRHTIGQTRTIQRRGDLGAYRPGPVSTVGRSLVELGIDVGGQIEIIPQYDQAWMGALLEYAFGAVNTTGSDPYDHAFTLDIDGPTGANGKALTIQSVRGQHASVDRAEVFAGCVISAIELRADARGEVRMILDVLGRSSAGPGSISGTATFPVGEEMLAHHSSLIGWNSQTHQAVSWAIRYDKRLGRRPFVGSQLTDYPQPTDQAEITVTATLEHINDNLYDAYIAGDQGDMTINLTGAGGSTPGDHGLDNTIHECRITQYSRPVDTAGVLREQVTWMANATPTKAGWACTLQNNDSSHM